MQRIIRSARLAGGIVDESTQVVYTAPDEYAVLIHSILLFNDHVSENVTVNIWLHSNTLGGKQASLSIPAKMDWEVISDGRGRILEPGESVYMQCSLNSAVSYSIYGSEILQE